MGNVTITELLLPLVVFLVAVFLLVKFVKWAWHQGEKPKTPRREK